MQVAVCTSLLQTMGRDTKDLTEKSRAFIGGGQRLYCPTNQYIGERAPRPTGFGVYAIDLHLILLLEYERMPACLILR